MRIAIPSKDKKGLDSFVEEHFGRARFYTFVDIDDETKEIKKVEAIETPFESHGPGDIPHWVKDNGASVVLALGMGPRAVSFFEQLGVHVVTGVVGRIGDVIKDFISGTLKTVEWKPPEHEREHRGHVHGH